MIKFIDLHCVKTLNSYHPWPLGTRISERRGKLWETCQANSTIVVGHFAQVGTTTKYTVYIHIW